MTLGNIGWNHNTPVGSCFQKPLAEANVNSKTNTEASSSRNSFKTLPLSKLARRTYVRTYVPPLFAKEKKFVLVRRPTVDVVSTLFNPTTNLVACNANNCATPIRFSDETDPILPVDTLITVRRSLHAARIELKASTGARQMLSRIIAANFTLDQT